MHIERGILHGDLKPANVMVSELGIAEGPGLRPRQGSSGLSNASRLTASRDRPWLVVGTAAYMSPEQALGLATDERSDIFSFGVMLYEMATGRPAFTGATPAEVLHAVLHAQPEPVAKIRRGLPASLSVVLQKAVTKEPSQRYQHMSDLAADLRRVQRPTSGINTVVLSVGAVVLAALIWFAMSITRESPDPSSAQVVIDDVTAGRTRIAVLPFENLTRRPDDDWMASAFSDSLTLGLQSLDSLTFVSRTGIAHAYREQSLREADRLEQELLTRVAKFLGVRYYIHGSYQKTGDQLWVSARLVEIGVGIVKVQESVTDKLVNLLHLQDALARKFAGALEGGKSFAAMRRQAMSLAAYREITDGRGLYASGRFDAGVESFKRAVDSIQSLPKHGPSSARVSLVPFRR